MIDLVLPLPAELADLGAGGGLLAILLGGGVGLEALDRGVGVGALLRLGLGVLLPLGRHVGAGLRQGRVDPRALLLAGDDADRLGLLGAGQGGRGARLRSLPGGDLSRQRRRGRGDGDRVLTHRLRGVAAGVAGSGAELGLERGALTSGAGRIGAALHRHSGRGADGGGGGRVAGGELGDRGGHRAGVGLESAPPSPPCTAGRRPCRREGPAGAGVGAGAGERHVRRALRRGLALTVPGAGGAAAGASPSPQASRVGAPRRARRAVRRRPA
ncbi:MAG: hypothetical protein H6701_14275 [Myxococcales bacterium]|nr:hypothetical protein [Myxococcales bacterium]